MSEDLRYIGHRNGIEFLTATIKIGERFGPPEDQVINAVMKGILLEVNHQSEKVITDGFLSKIKIEYRKDPYITTVVDKRIISAVCWKFGRKFELTPEELEFIKRNEFIDGNTEISTLPPEILAHSYFDISFKQWGNFVSGYSGPQPKLLRSIVGHLSYKEDRVNQPAVGDFIAEMKDSADLREKLLKRGKDFGRRLKR